MMKHPYFIPLMLVLVFTVGFYSGMAVLPKEPKLVRELINYAAQAPTTEEGGQGIRQHPVIGAITSFQISSTNGTGKLEVYGRKGSRIWYYPE
jgi:hypothetical protein